LCLKATSGVRLLWSFDTASARSGHCPHSDSLKRAMAYAFSIAAAFLVSANYG